MKYTSRTICYFILVGFVLVGLVWGFWGLLLYHVVCGFAASIVLICACKKDASLNKFVLDLLHRIQSRSFRLAGVVGAFTVFGIFGLLVVINVVREIRDKC